MILSLEPPIMETKEMYSNPRFIGIHAQPGKYLNIILAILPFLLTVSFYVVISQNNYSNYVKHEEALDRGIESTQEFIPVKLLPTVGIMFERLKKISSEEDRRTGKIILWSDTFSSLTRIGAGLGFAAIFGFLLGLNLGIFPGLRNLLLPFITFISNIPPLAILPIFLIVFGQGEFAKITLILIGTVFPITRDITYAVSKTPVEKITKGLTLGGSQLGIAYRVIMPLNIPRLLELVRLQLGAGWLFLIASEAISADSGLGYRIFLMIRYLSMDLIIVYVLWITLIAFTVETVLKAFTKWMYPWYYAKS